MTRRQLLHRLTLPLMAAAMIGCQLVPGGASLPGASLGIDLTPATLTEPTGFDWMFHRIGGANVAVQREANIQRELLAFPNTTNWSGGLNLTSFGCSATDTVPNGFATVFASKYTNPALVNKVIMLTKEGKLIKVDRTNTADHEVLNLNDTFSRTYVTLNPNSGRAYVVSDAGNLYVVHLHDATARAMTLKQTVSLGAGAYGCAVSYDPYASQQTGHYESVYVPTNDGNVRKFIWDRGSFTATATYPVATGVTPLSSGDATRKIKAPAIVLNGVIYVGDQGGRLNVYNTTDTTKNLAFGTGSPINTAPAIEIQDANSNEIDPNTGTRVPNGTPIYAFVNSGVNTYWLNLYSQTSTRSIALYTDDFTPAAPKVNKNFGYLKQWNYDTAYSSTSISLTDWCTIRTDDDTYLAGIASGNKTRDYITAADADADDRDGTYAGNVVCYMRFSTGTTSTAVVKKAEITMRVTKNYVTKVPEFRVSSPYLKGTSTLWDYASLTNATRPSYGSTNESIWLGAAENASTGNVQVNPGSPGKWDITEAFAGPASSDYGVVMVYNKGGKVLWDAGEKSEDPGNVNNNSKHYVINPEFRTAGTDIPTFTVGSSTGEFPTPTIETPPVIDAKNKKVYVFYGNAMYAMSYASTTAWTDGDPAALGTVYTLTHLGRMTGSGATQYKGSSYNNRTKYIANLTAPVFNYDLSYAYVLDRYPNPATDQTAPTAWDYGLSKIKLPLKFDVDQLQAATTTITNVPGDASNYMVIDFFTNTTTVGGNVFFGLGNGKVYQYDAY